MHPHLQLIQERIAQLRPKLMDTSRRNPLINNSLSRSNASFIRIVDEKPQSIWEKLLENNQMLISPLPALEIDPPDEQNREFQNAVDSFKNSDDIYLTAMNKIDFEQDDKAFAKAAVLERDLKDRVRESLGYAPRINKADLSSLSEHARLHGINPEINLPEPSHIEDDDRYVDNELQTLMLPKSLEANLQKIANKNKTLQEDKGIDTLYLCLGYLSWIDPSSKDASTPFLSPLWLLPITLTSKATKKGKQFYISLRDEPTLNPVLIHKLKHELGIEFPSVEASDVHSIEDFFERKLCELPFQINPKIHRRATIGMYPYTGISMYMDLDPNGIDFGQFGVLATLLAGVDAEGNSHSASELTEDDIESTFADALVPHTVVDADSSQYLALMKVANGHNLAIEGPPGSGKSQTIVNMIANALQSNKKILFVAQKNTALEVVHNRLASLGLDKFVLPVTGQAQTTQEFYEALEERVGLRRLTVNEQEISILKTRILEQKQQLQHYIDFLQESYSGTELNNEQILGLVIRHDEGISELPEEFQVSSIELSALPVAHTTSLVKQLKDLAKAWVKEFIHASPGPQSFWGRLDSKVPTYAQKIDFTDALSDTTLATERLFEAFPDLNVQKVSPLLMSDQTCAFDDKINTLNMAHEFSVSWENATQDPSGAVHLIDQFIEKEAIQKQKEKEFNCSWPVLMNSIALADEAALVVNYGKKRNIDRITNQTFVDERLAIEKDVRAANNVLAFKERLHQKCGFTPEIKYLKVIAEFILADPLLLEPSIFNTLKKDFDLLKSELLTAEKTLKKISLLFESKSSVPSDKDLKTVRNELADDGFMRMFSGELKKAKSQSASWFGFSKYDKTTILPKLDEALSHYKEWNSLDSVAFLSLTDIAQSGEQITKAMELLSKLSMMQSRLAYSTSELSDLLKYDIISDVEHERELIHSLNYEDAWFLFTNKLEELAKKVEELDALHKRTSHIQRVVIESLHGRLSLLDNILTNSDDYLQLDKDLTLLSSSLNSFFALSSNLPVELLQKLRDLLLFVDQIGWSEGQHQSFGEAFKEFLSLADAVKRHWETFLRAVKVCGAEQLVPNDLYVFTQFGKEVLADKVGFEKSVNYDDLRVKIQRTGLWSLLKDICHREDISDQDKPSKIAFAVLHSMKSHLLKTHGAQIFRFGGINLSEARKAFQNADRELIKINSAISFNNAYVPLDLVEEGIDFGRKSEYTDLSLIIHQLNLKRRISPTKLIKRSTDALLDLHPCWMMVPNTVATMLPRQELFDLVIIDEASQMTPEHSFSCLMRAKQAVIVGDTNQLPPSNFFRVVMSDGDDDGDGDGVVEESILEMANSAFHPKHRLQWHYRSKHESLIAFSNHYIYDNELIIFPSCHAKSEVLGVSLVQIQGNYQSGLNIVEGKEVVSQATKFMARYPEKSLGIVTMNSSQQEQIESMIYREMDDNPAVADYIEHWNSEQKGLERFFVKNLENVQGDERDVIFISTVYGKNPEGKFYQQFGPINGASGKRRLNVLFTRAKEHIRTFSSIPMDMFNPNETNEGATLLKRWLEYSFNGRLGEVLDDGRDSKGLTDSPFEDAVIEVIESLGYIATPQVGVSSYKIDIGVSHKDYPMGYLCGVECDGATYHSSKSARDRDILRQEVLERLGWQLYRIWSTDWFRDKVAQKDLLKKYLDALLKESIAAMPEVVVEEGTPGPTLYPDTSQYEDQDLGVSENITPMSQKIAVNSDVDQIIDVGSKIEIRYDGGVNKGVIAKYVMSEFKNGRRDDSYTLLSPSTPLGEALMGAEPGDIVSLQIKNEEIPISVLYVKN
mgnify:CR=1 FL=1